MVGCIQRDVVELDSQALFALIAARDQVVRVDAPRALVDLMPDAQIALYDALPAGYQPIAPGLLPTLTEGAQLPRPTRIVDTAGNMIAPGSALLAQRVSVDCPSFVETQAIDLGLAGSATAVARVDSTHLLVSYTPTPECQTSTGGVRRYPHPTNLVLFDTARFEWVPVSPGTGRVAVWSAGDGTAYASSERRIFRFDLATARFDAPEAIPGVPASQGVLALTGTVTAEGLELYALVVAHDDPSPTATVYRRDARGTWADLGPHAGTTNTLVCHSSVDHAAFDLVGPGRPRFVYRSGTIWERDPAGDWHSNRLLDEGVGPCRAAGLRAADHDLLVIGYETPVDQGAAVFERNQEAWDRFDSPLIGAYAIVEYRSSLVVSGDYSDRPSDGLAVSFEALDTIGGPALHDCGPTALSRASPWAMYADDQGLYHFHEGKACQSWISRWVRR